MILICGLPNAGKTTYSAQFQNVVHIDEIAGIKHYHDIIKQRLDEADGELCVEGTFLVHHAREKVLRLCKPEWKKTCIWLNTDPNECKRREDRGRRPWLIDNCERCFQPPTYDEGWDEIIVVKDGKEGLLETSNTHSPLERGTVGDVPPAEQPRSSASGQL